MTTRPSTASLVCALAFSLVITPTSLVSAQTNAAPDMPSTNAAPTAPAPATGPVTTPAPADTTAAPATTETPGERPTSYTMVAGDTLDSIAKKFDTSIHALAKLNKIPKSKYKKLKTGTVLQIPPAPSTPTK